MEKDWINDLRTKMQDYCSPEPEGLWKDISASLGKDGLSSGLSRKQRRGKVVRILSGFAAAAAVLLLALILWPQPENSVDVLSDASELGKGAAVPEEIVSGTELPGEDAAVAVHVGDVMSGQGQDGLPDENAAVDIPVQDMDVYGREGLLDEDFTEDIQMSDMAENGVRVTDVSGTDSAADSWSVPPVETGAEDGVGAGDVSLEEASGEYDAATDVIRKEIRSGDLLADAGGQTDAIPDAVPEEAVFSISGAVNGHETGRQRQEDNIRKYEEKYSWPVDNAPDVKGRLSAGDKRKSIISTDIFYSNLPGSADSRSGYESLFASPVSLRREQVQEMVTMSSPGEVTLFSDEQDLGTEIRHRQPVRAGISFRYDLGRRWGIETGLTYTMLSSDINAGSDFRRCMIERKLHYIGIPLNVSYDFLQRRLWTVYATAGGMLEKCVSGREAAEYISNGMVSSSAANEVSVRELQWSVNAAVGAGFHFTPHIGIFAEPGVSWFFDNGSTVGTIYRDRPLNFSFRVGLRFFFH